MRIKKQVSLILTMVLCFSCFCVGVKAEGGNEISVPFFVTVFEETTGKLVSCVARLWNNIFNIDETDIPNAAVNPPSWEEYDGDEILTPDFTLSAQTWVMNELIFESGYMGFDDNGLIATGLGFACEKGNELIGEFLNDYDDIAIGQDFGFNHANAILLLGIKDGDIYIIDEIYLHEKSTSEVVQEAIKHGIPTKKMMWCDSAEPDRIKEWSKAGFRAKGVDKGGSKGSVNAQIDWLKQRNIFVHPHCINTIKEMQQWKWKKDEKSGEYLDEPVPIMDDAMAALRYGVEGWRKVKQWLL